VKYLATPARPLTARSALRVFILVVAMLLDPLAVLLLLAANTRLSRAGGLAMEEG